MTSVLFGDFTQCTELLCQVKSQKNADLAVALLCPLVFHLYLPLTFFTIGALLLVHLIPLAFCSISFDYCNVCSFQYLDLAPLISCMFSTSALHLIQSHSFISFFSVPFIPFPFHCVLLIFPLLFL